MQEKFLFVVFIVMCDFEKICNYLVDSICEGIEQMRKYFS